MKIKIISISFLIAIVGIVACKKKSSENITPTPDTNKSIEEYIKGAPQPVQAVASDTVSVGQPVFDKSDKNYYCTTKKVAAGYAFSEQIVMNPQTDVIYPGALLDGNSVVSGAYTPILADRAPMTISTNMDNLVGDKSIVIDKPSLSEVREGVSKLLQKGVDGNTASLMSFEYYDVSSESNLNVALGVSSSTSAKIAGGIADVSTKIKASLNYGSVTKKNKFIFRFIQSYYTIDIDKPSSPKGFFANTVTTAELAKAMPSYTAPVYVASVNYGRAVYVCVQSDYSFQDIKSEWEMNVNAKVEVKAVNSTAETNFTTAIEKSTKLMESSISVTAIGGSAQGASSLVNVSNLKEIANVIFSGANWGKNNPGLPISYKLCRLADNQTFSVIDYNEFTVKNCQKTYSTVSLAYFKSLQGTDHDVIGSIYAVMGYEGETGSEQRILIWQKNQDQWVHVDNGKNMPSPYEANQVFNFDPLKKDKVYFRIETNLKDRDIYSSDDYKELDDTYDVNTTAKFLLSSTSNSRDKDGNYLMTIASSNQLHEEKTRCCGWLGNCANKCFENHNEGQNIQLQLAFNINF